VEEDSYRQSRLCRVLGNPVAFAVVELLAENKELTACEPDFRLFKKVQMRGAREIGERKRIC
jgi:hypothetical protein